MNLSIVFLILAKMAIGWFIFIYVILRRAKTNGPFDTGLKYFAWTGFFIVFSSPGVGLQYIDRLFSILVFGPIAFLIGFIYGTIKSKKNSADIDQSAPDDDINQVEPYPNPVSGSASMTTNYFPKAAAPTKKPNPFLTVVDEDKIYDQIAEELETGKTDKSLWTRLFAETDGDERRMKALYIKKRAERLIAAEKLRLEQEHVTREQPYKASPLDEPQIQPPIQEEVQPIRQLTPKEIEEREAIRDRLAESIRQNKIQNTINVNSSSSEQKYDHETIKLIKKYVSDIEARRATYETYDRFLYLIGGNIEAKGFIFGMHHIITYKGSKTRINNFLEIISWFETNILPEFKNLQNLNAES